MRLTIQIADLSAQRQRFVYIFMSLSKIVLISVKPGHVAIKFGSFVLQSQLFSDLERLHIILPGNVMIKEATINVADVRVQNTLHIRQILRLKNTQRFKKFHQRISVLSPSEVNVTALDQ